MIKKRKLRLYLGLNAQKVKPARGGGSLNGGLRRNLFKVNVKNKLKLNYFYDLEQLPSRESCK